MNDHWEEIMWAYVDGQASPSDEKQLLEISAENPDLSARLKAIKVLHAQLKELPVVVPNPALGSQIMNQITNQEIEAQISSTHSSKELSLIPFILLIFGSLIIIGIILLWLLQNNDGSFVIPEKFQLSERKATLIGYTGVMFLCVVLMYRYSMGSHHRSV